MKNPQIITLFSGGLDSLLTAKLLERQGLTVRCLHFTAPFFGSAASVPHWRQEYGLDIAVQDVSEAFAALLRAWPAHGFGKVLNPCVDCKILLLREARKYMEAVGAQGLATGEVLGQRPMSQRRDTLNVILRDAAVRDVLLRPLSALHLPPTPLEESGLVDRDRLLGIWGRGRQDQLALAREMGIREVPTPGGGCRLTVGGKTKFACVDGPDFDGHKVDYAELMNRNGVYRDQEAENEKTHMCRMDKLAHELIR